MFKIENDWDIILEKEIKKQSYISLRNFLKEEYQNQIIYPSMDNLFSCLKLTSFSNTSVVVLGQDPYHGPMQAHGLCFSVQEGTRCPPSLVNIFKEIKSDLNKNIPSSGDLTRWAKQGVLLLNTVLTVRQGNPNSHKNKGWEEFTDAIICSLNAREKPVVFLLWGANAHLKEKLITNSNHLVLKSAHPSPLSAYNGFFGCKHFSKANQFLAKNNMLEIDW